MKVLGLGTYPILLPVHGGQRRVSQIANYYRLNDIEYRYASVYSSTSYSPEKVTEGDYPYASIGGIYSEIPFIDDLGSGVFAASQDGAYRHFRTLIQGYQPDVIQFEQPWMWPLIRKLRDEGVCLNTALIYSSQNFEPPLKRQILESVGVDRDRVALAERMILDLEAELTGEADLLICVSKADAAAYKALNPRCTPLVVRNGAERPSETKRPPYGELMKANSYLYYVGSAYPPNIQGFERFILNSTLYGFPPEKLFAVCGGASEAIYGSSLYGPHAEGHGDRVHFFTGPSDAELAWLRENSKGILLPIANGGGSNLKTAEAIASGKWVITTDVALRSFEDYQTEPGILVARTPRDFQQAMLDVIYGKPLKLTAKQVRKREALLWDRLLADSGLAGRVLALGPVLDGKGAA